MIDKRLLMKTIWPILGNVIWLVLVVAVFLDWLFYGGQPDNFTLMVVLVLTVMLTDDNKFLHDE